MKIVIIGPGALGCLLAAALGTTSSPGSIRLLDHDQQRAAKLATQGLVLEKDGRRSRVMLPVSAEPTDIGRAEIVLLCVKSGNVPTGLAVAEAVVAPGGVVVTLQNGIGHLPLLDRLPMDVAIGVTSLGAHLAAPGQVRYAGCGPTRLGFVSPPGLEAARHLAALADRLTEVDIVCEVVDNILHHVWGKLLINIGINALTALNGCANGELLATPANRDLLIAAVREAEKVARARGIAVQQDPVAATMEVCRATAKNISSMLQDVRRQRPTEIDAINGAIVAEAKKMRIPVPTNEDLVRAIKAIEQAYGQ